jgi:hypothetical protein
VTYTFRNRFKIGGNRYAVDGHEYVLAEPPSDDGRVVLKSGSGQAISQTDELILQGSGYPDFDAAKAAGRRWRQYLTKALPRDAEAQTSVTMAQVESCPSWTACLRKNPQRLSQ